LIDYVLSRRRMALIAKRLFATFFVLTAVLLFSWFISFDQSSHYRNTVIFDLKRCKGLCSLQILRQRQAKFVWSKTNNSFFAKRPNFAQSAANSPEDVFELKTQVAADFAQTKLAAAIKQADPDHLKAADSIEKIVTEPHVGSAQKGNNPTKPIIAQAKNREGVIAANRVEMVRRSGLLRLASNVSVRIAGIECSVLASAFAGKRWAELCRRCSLF
jgi:hypothetical protein